MAGCCNPWNGTGPNTTSVCGSFETPTNPDLGQCFPYREKRTCERPVRPENPCNDTNAYAEPRPGLTPPFALVSTLFDEDCDAILDETGAAILTTS